MPWYDCLKTVIMKVWHCVKVNKRRESTTCVDLRWTVSVFNFCNCPKQQRSSSKSVFQCIHSFIRISHCTPHSDVHYFDNTANWYIIMNQEFYIPRTANTNIIWISWSNHPQWGFIVIIQANPISESVIQALQTFIWIQQSEAQALYSPPVSQQCRDDSGNQSPCLFYLPEVVHQLGFSQTHTHIHAHTHTDTGTFLSKDSCSLTKKDKWARTKAVKGDCFLYPWALKAST